MSVNKRRSAPAQPTDSQNQKKNLIFDASVKHRINMFRHTNTQIAQPSASERLNLNEKGGCHTVNMGLNEAQQVCVCVCVDFGKHTQP